MVMVCPFARRWTVHQCSVTSAYCARSPSSVKSSGPGAGHKGLRAQAADFIIEGCTAARVKMGRDLVQQAGSAARRNRAQARGALARISEISSAFCSPVEQSLAGTPLAAKTASRSARWGPTSVRPAAMSRGRLSAECGLQVLRHQDRAIVRAASAVGKAVVAHACAAVSASIAS